MTATQQLAIDFGCTLLVYFAFVSLVFSERDADTREWRKMLYIFGAVVAALCVIHVVFVA